MKKIILKLSSFYNENESFGKRLAYANVDDIFRELVRLGIMEISLNRNEMLIITGFLAANCSTHQCFHCEKVPIIYKILTEGKASKFFGVKLILEDDQK